MKHTSQLIPDHPIIKQVDERKLHQSGDTDFSDFQTHLSNPKIPKNEIWINEKLDKEDHHVAAIIAIQEWKDMRDGISLDKSLDGQRKLEVKVRRKDKDHHLDAKPYPSGKEYDPGIEVNPDVPIFIVDGDAVRNLYSTSNDNPFQQGGHDLRYPYIASWCKKESFPGGIWIDKIDLDKLDYAPTLHHEIHERNNMAKGMSYEPAHKLATASEKKFRSAS